MNIQENHQNDLLQWLQSKLKCAEQQLKSREEMASPVPISSEEWEKLKSNPKTIFIEGKKLSKAKQEQRRKEREQEIAMHKRLAVKCRHEVEMFKAVIELIEIEQKPR